MIYHVVAVSKNNVIGKDGKLPWHFPADLKFFRRLTTGHAVIMGRKTFDGLGKALPDRQNIVVSRQAHSEVAGVEFVTSVAAAIRRAKSDRVFIIGGASIYGETMDSIDGVYLTRIDRAYEGDAFYPGLPAGFAEVSRQTLQENPLVEAIVYRPEIFNNG